MTTNAEIVQRRDVSVARAIAYSSTFVAAKARDGEVWDVEGKRYIDFCGGIGCQNVGHRHPKVIAAMEKQLHSFTHTCFQISPYENYVELAERPTTKDKRPEVGVGTSGLCCEVQVVIHSEHVSTGVGAGQDWMKVSYLADGLGCEIELGNRPCSKQPT